MMKQVPGMGFGGRCWA